MSNLTDILTLIDEGDEMEMPRGVAIRLDQAGFMHPGASSRTENVKLIEQVIAPLIFDDSIDERSVNAVAAGLLAVAGVTR